MKRTKRPSYKQPGLPRIRPCEDCGEERQIVARGLCDRCRKKEERKEAGMNYPALGHRQTQGEGLKILAKLFELMTKAKLPRANRERVLQNFGPFLGLSPESQQSLIRDMTGPDLEQTESPFARVHLGSSEAPADSEVRKPM